MTDSTPSLPRARLFLSYGRRDAAELAGRLRADLEALGYEVWQDTRQIRPGKGWEQEIQDGLRSTQVVIALLSPHAVRRSPGADGTSILVNVDVEAGAAPTIAMLAAQDRIAIVRDAGR